jgi:hypothetical protein
MLASADGIRQAAQQVRRCAAVQLPRLGAIDAPTLEYFFRERRNQKNSNFRRRGANPKSAA